ncbi:MAG: hypothetical protein ACKOE2_07245, partial [Actinomycetales bacterium]
VVVARVGVAAGTVAAIQAPAVAVARVGMAAVAVTEIPVGTATVVGTEIARAFGRGYSLRIR